MSRISKGVMEIVLNGTEYELKATVAATEAIDQRFGGFAKAAQACMGMSFADATFILSKAANLNKEETKALKQNIVLDGIEAAIQGASDYLMMLVNPEGGQSDLDEEASGEA